MSSGFGDAGTEGTAIKYEVPGQSKASLGSRHASLVFLLSFLGAGVAVVMEVILVGRNQFFSVYTLLTVLMGSFLVFAAILSFKSDDLTGRAWGVLSDDHHRMWREHVGNNGNCDNLRRFIDAFRPPQEQIDQILKTTALRIAKACELQIKFQNSGLHSLVRDGGCDLAEVRANDDPELLAQDLRKLSSQKHDELQMEVDVAKREFWRLYHLAKSLGYDVHKSWKPYAGLSALTFIGS